MDNTINTSKVHNGLNFRLRNFIQDDAKQFADIECCQKNKKYLFPPIIKTHEEFITKFRQMSHADFGLNCYAIEAIPEGKLMGRVALTKLNHPSFSSYKNTQEVTIVIDKKYWERGFATKIIQLIVKIAFSEEKINSVLAIIDPKNARSLKLFEKCNFKNIDRIDVNYQGSEEVWHEVYELKKINFISKQK